MSDVDEQAPVLKVPAGHEALQARQVGPAPATPDGAHASVAPEPLAT
jgi:hypothetical protein